MESLLAYVEPIRASGAKVAVGTVLPQYHASSPDYNRRFNARRAEVNQALRSLVGSRIDAVIDYAADPEMGSDAAAMNTALYSDGVHPTDGCGMGCGGQGKLAAVYLPVVDALLKHD
jgi:hypothetical protein